MRIKNLKLKNWRNFQAVDITFGERAFIVGPNASGKSNLLDALKFIRDVARTGGGLQKALEERGGVSRVRSLAARRDPTIEIDVTLGAPDETDWRYRIEIKQDQRGNRLPYIIAEQAWSNGKLVLNRPNETDKLDALSLTQTHLEQISANKNFREIAEFFGELKYLHVVPQLVRNPDAFRGGGKGVPGDPFGLHFLYELSKSPQRTRDSRLRKLETVLKVAVPQLEELSFIQDDQGVPHLEAKYVHWRPQGGKQREDQFSDGTLRLIGLLWSLLETERLLLLEEPELSLHPALVRRLPGLMYRLQRTRKKQVLITTHSADLLADPGISPEEVFLLEPGKDGTLVWVAANIEEVATLLKSGMSAGEAILPRTEPKNLTQLSLFGDDEKNSN